MRVRNRYPRAADVVAQVEQLVKLESLVADGIFLHVNLQLLPALLQVRKPGLAHQPDRHDASGHAHVDRAISPVPRRLAEYSARICGNGVREFVFRRISALPQRFNLLQLLAPQFVYFFVECQWSPLIER